MSAAPERVRAAGAADSGAARAKGAARPAALTRRHAVAARLREGWPGRAAWALARTGRPGLAGLALLAGAAIFLASTYRDVAADVETLRAQVAARPARARPDAQPTDPLAAVRALPPRAEVPAILRQLFEKATRAKLAIDSGRYEVVETKGGAVVRYRIAFPVSGPYPQVRAFLDATLATMPAVALGELALERKAIGDGAVEARIGMTVYTGPGGAAAAGPTPERVVAPVHAAALFAPHTWVAPLPLAPVPPPPPPPAPSAPPLPFAFLGSFAPGGEAPVYFLARGDRVFDARVGDTLDGVYRLESAAGGQLVFVYLPLDVRQTLAAGGVK